MGDVVQLDYSDGFGDGIVIDPDQILQNSVGEYQRVIVAGFEADGSFSLRSSHDSREALWILQQAILHLMLET